MKYVKCPLCDGDCIKYGTTKFGSQRWQCKKCGNVFTIKIDSSAKQLKSFLKWLFGKQTQAEMPGEGRTFRRKTAKFWDIWPMPPKIEEARDIVFVDGIYIARKACVLICCDKKNVLGWYLCRYEHSAAWEALISRIAEPEVVVSDGGKKKKKALKRKWKNADHQRCIYHVFCQIRRYTAKKPKTTAGQELYFLAKELLKLNSLEESNKWIDSFLEWIVKYKEFLSQMTYDENGNYRPTHERLLKAERALIKLIKQKTMFTYLDKKLAELNVPSTNNLLEGGVNSQLRAMLREHRGMSVERRLKAVYWWCYMHSPKPLSASEILKNMPTDKSISDIYAKITKQNKPEKSIPTWGDAIVWSEFHRSDKFPVDWD